MNERWKCWCGADAVVVYVLDCDPETVERAPGEVVPTRVAVCAAHDPRRSEERLP